MSSKDIRRIVIVGSGNVATQLSVALKAAGLEILQVYSREMANAKILAKKLNSGYISDLKSLHESADLYILSVSDDALIEVIKSIPNNDALIVHTSGTSSVKVFDSYFVTIFYFMAL